MSFGRDGDALVDEVIWKGNLGAIVDAIDGRFPAASTSSQLSEPTPIYFGMSAEEEERYQINYRIREEWKAKERGEHRALVSLPSTIEFKELKSEISKLAPINEIEDHYFFLPTLDGKKSIFNIILENKNFNTEQKIELIELLGNKSYDKYFYHLCTNPLLQQLEKQQTDLIIVAFAYRNMISKKQGSITPEQQIEIWKALRKLDAKHRIDAICQIIAAMKYVNDARQLYQYIEFNINECNSPIEIIDFYNRCSSLLKGTYFEVINTNIFKHAKLRVLTLQAEEKQIPEDKEAKTTTLSTTEKLIVEKFLNMRRPSKFQFFTQRMNTSSMEIYNKVEEKKLTPEQARAKINAKAEKNARSLQKKLDEIAPRARGYY